MDKNEGEFKTRTKTWIDDIRQRLDEWADMGIDRDQDFIEEQVGYVEATLFKIYAEAKQEIEAWRQKHPCCVAKKQTERDYTDTDEFYKARDEWLEEGMTILERWFGLPKLW